MKRDLMTVPEVVLPELSLLAGTQLRLRSADVELWRVSLDEQSDEVTAYLADLLSADEHERARTFYFQRDQRRFVVGRGVLRVLLGRYLDCPPEEVAFRYGANGKPSLAMPGSEPLYFNLAHSEALALYAFTRTGEVGVDLERVREMPDWVTIAHTCFPPEDQARILGAGAAQRLAEFFRAWTRQEARLKAVGTGFGADFEPEAMRRLSLFPVRVAPDYEAALALSAPARWVTCFAWEDSRKTGRLRPVRRSRRSKLELGANGAVEFL